MPPSRAPAVGAPAGGHAAPQPGGAAAVSGHEVPSGVARGISLAIAGAIACAMLVGAITLYLASQIHRTSEAIDGAHRRLHLIARVQSSVQQVIAALHSMQFRGNFDRLPQVGAQAAELSRHLESFRAAHPDEAGVVRSLPPSPALTAMQGLAERLQGVIERVSLAPGRRRELSATDLEQLGVISNQLPRFAAQLQQEHGARVEQLLDANRRTMRSIGLLHLALLAVGIGLIALTRRAVGRQVALPLRRLADAAAAIAEGRATPPVPAEAANEIGQLCRAFNAMAERLQARESEIRTTREQLERRVQELTALFRLGTQISALHELDQILDSVADTACDLLGTDAAAILLLNLERNALTVRALSGPPNAFQPSVRLRKPIPLIEALDAEAQHRQLLWPEFLRAHLSATLSRGATVLGVLCVASRSSREFSAMQRDLLNALAMLASIAVEDARLSEQARGIGILEERDRLAREIHDGLAQILALLHLRLQRLLEQATREGSEALAAEVRDLVSVAGHAYDEVRQSISGLRSPASRGLGLVPTLRDCLKQFSAETDLPVELDVPNAYAIRLRAAAEAQVIRIIQEALANVRRHAEATRAWVRLSVHEAYVQVVIEDDGRGFDPACVEDGGRGRFGLQTMQERAASVGGGLQVDSAPGKGTRVTAWIPLEG